MSTRGSTANGSTLNKHNGTQPIAEQDAAVNGVFLSPRVVDRRAYGELAEDLRDLVRQASSERAAITGMLDQAGKATQDLRQREQAQQGNIELTARALKTMDDRSARIERLLTQATEQSKVFEKLESHAATLIDSKIETLESRLLAVTAGATSQAEALEERVRRASRELEQRIEAIRRDAQSIAGPAQEALERACDRATKMASSGAGSLGDLVARGERVADTASNIASTLETAAARVQSNREAITEIQQKAEQVEQTLSAARARLDQQQTQSVNKSQEAIDGVQLMLAQVREQTSAARGDGASAVAELRAVIQQSIDAHNTTSLAIKVLSKTIEQAKGITDQLEPWRAVLGGHEPGQMPEPIRKLIEGVRGELTGELSSIASALRAAAESADRTGRSLASVPIQTPRPAPVAPDSSPAPNAPPHAAVPGASALPTTPATSPARVERAAPVVVTGHPLIAARVNARPNLPASDQIIGR